MTSDELERLQHLRQAPTAPLREVQRAHFLTRYHAGETVTQIARHLHMTRKSVSKWINRALAVGPNAALKDAYHRSKEPSITEEARAWVVSLACVKPKDLGYAAEVWTRSAPANRGVDAIHRGIAVATDLNCGALLLYAVRLGTAPDSRPGHRIRGIATPRAFVDQFHSSWVGMRFDAGNVMQYGYPENWILTLGPRVKRIHFKGFKLGGCGQPVADLLEGDVNWWSPNQPDPLKQVSAA